MQGRSFLWCCTVSLVVSGFAVAGCKHNDIQPADSTGSQRLVYLIPPTFEEIGPFSEGLAAARSSEKVGYVDQSGKFVITTALVSKPSNESELDFLAASDPEQLMLKGTVSASSASDKLGAQILTGLARATIASEAHKNLPFPFSNGLAVAALNGRYGYIDHTGAWSIRPMYQDAKSFSNGLAAVSLDGSNWSYIDKANRVITTRLYTFAGRFVRGIAEVGVRQGSKESLLYGFINLEGQEIIHPQFTELSGFSEALATFALDPNDDRQKLGVIDTQGKEIIEPKYDVIGPFSEGLAAFCNPDCLQGGKFGYIDPADHWKINPLFDEAGAFKDGLAVVRVGEKYGYIDKSGTLVKAPTFDAADAFSDGLALVKVDDKYGYIDRSGLMTIKPIFSDADDFHDGIARVCLDFKCGALRKP
jgi:hypothetical protein